MADEPSKTPGLAATAPQSAKNDKENDAALDRQRKLSERIIASKTSHLKPGHPELDTKLTTADHVGQHPAQPYKSEEQEARKVGDFSRIGLEHGEEVKTTDFAIPGAENATEAVVLHEGESPEDAAARIAAVSAAPANTPTAPLGTEATGVAATVEEHPVDRDVANLPRSGASVNNGDGKEGGKPAETVPPGGENKTPAGGSPPPGGAAGSHGS